MKQNEEFIIIKGNKETVAEIVEYLEKTYGLIIKNTWLEVNHVVHKENKNECACSNGNS